MSSSFEKRDIRRRVNRLTPSQVLAIFFFVVIITGAVLLMLPVSTVKQGSINFIDALFTSTSAVCVTGLVVVDTGTTYTYFGRTVIMLLIQFDGLGIMTYASVIYGFLKRRMSVSNMLVMREALNQDSMSYLRSSVSNIAKMTFIIELIGAFLFSFRYIPMYGPLKGLFFSVFHAVSAFCNAGFDINAGYMTSITEFVSDPLIVLTTAALIIIGGTGFAVIHEITHYKKNKKISLQARVVVGMTLFLLAFGTACIFFLELNNPGTLGDPNMPMGTKLMSAFFQSVTVRTAGYNTIDQMALTLPSKLLCTALMFIGASPASTGGGIKTTTFCIMLMAIFSAIRGDENVEFKYRRISHSLTVKAFAITFIGAVWVLGAGLLLMIAEPGISMEATFYEVTSAFATVGLSLGVTPTLSSVSKVVLIITMFAGRVGPLTLLMAMMGTKNKKKLIKNVESTIMIG